MVFQGRIIKEAQDSKNTIFKTENVWLKHTSIRSDVTKIHNSKVSLYRHKNGKKKDIQG